MPSEVATDLLTAAQQVAAITWTCLGVSTKCFKVLHAGERKRPHVFRDRFYFPARSCDLPLIASATVNKGHLAGCHQRLLTEVLIWKAGKRPVVCGSNGSGAATFLNSRPFMPNSIGYSQTMSKPISDLKLMISSMEPVLNDGAYVFTSVPHGTDTSNIDSIASIREVQGITLVVSEKQAIEHGLRVLYRCSWITLNVHSDLNACGLTAAFSKALAEEGISCNVVAGACHDHIFVPVALESKALLALKLLQNS